MRREDRVPSVLAIQGGIEVLSRLHFGLGPFRVISRSPRAVDYYGLIVLSESNGISQLKKRNARALQHSVGSAHEVSTSDSCTVNPMLLAVSQAA